MAKRACTRYHGVVMAKRLAKPGSFAIGTAMLQSLTERILAGAPGAERYADLADLVLAAEMLEFIGSEERIHELAPIAAACVHERAMPSPSRLDRLEATVKTFCERDVLIHDVPGDGSCFFHCVAYALEKRNDLDGRVRAEIVRGMADYTEREEGYTLDPTYAEKMLQTSTWADGHVVQYCCRCGVRDMGVYVLALDTERGTVEPYCRGEPEGLRDANALVVCVDEQHFVLVVPRDEAAPERDGRRWWLRGEMPRACTRREFSDQDIDRILGC